ncbi:MAG: hypothetical protein GF308_02060 [Candidatus Heimdallarchaeota archaeon]|nr:hypothetical protein [Candidatus Heimdallarchaeota archaeon]
MSEKIQKRLMKCVEYKHEILIVTADEQKNIFCQFIVEDHGDKIEGQWEFTANEYLNNFELSPIQIQKLEEEEGFTLDVNYSKQYSCEKGNLEECFQKIAEKSVKILREIYNIQSFDSLQFESFN